MPGTWEFESDAAVDRLYLTSQSLITKGCVVQYWATGPLVIGKTVGFNYAFDYQGTRYDFPFRHTIIANDTVEDIADDLLAQLKLCDTARAAIGSEVFQHGVVVQDSGRFTMVFNQSWPFVINANPVITAYNESGSGLAVQVKTGDNTFEINPFTVYLRNPRETTGREPQPGDQIGGDIFVSDTVGKNASKFDDAPFYGMRVITIVDPSTDKHTSHQDHLFAFNSFRGITRHIARELAPRIRNKDELLAGVGSDFVREVTYSLLGIGSATSWQTIATIKPSGLSSSVNVVARVELDMQSTMTDGTGGSLVKHAEIRIANGVVSAGWAPVNPTTMGDVWTAGSASARLNVVGNDVQVQVQAASGKSLGSGLVMCKYVMPTDATGALQWTVE